MKRQSKAEHGKRVNGHASEGKWGVKVAKNKKMYPTSTKQEAKPTMFESLKSNTCRSGGALGGSRGALVDFNENHKRFLASKQGPGTKSRGAGRHRGGPRGGTVDAPRMHQRVIKQVRFVKKLRKCAI